MNDCTWRGRERPRIFWWEKIVVEIERWTMKGFSFKRERGKWARSKQEKETGRGREMEGSGGWKGCFKIVCAIEFMSAFIWKMNSNWLQRLLLLKLFHIYSVSFPLSPSLSVLSLSPPTHILVTWTLSESRKKGRDREEYFIRWNFLE